MIFFWIQLIVSLLFIFGLILMAAFFLFPIAFMAPYVPTSKKNMQTMLSLARVVSGEKAVDVGSGDGRIVVALAQAGAEAHGYEINPFLVLVSRAQIWRHGLRGKAFIHWSSFFKVDFSSFDIVTIYGLPSAMRQLEPILQKQLPKGARVVSHVFRFPNWEIDTASGDVRMYRNTC